MYLLCWDINGGKLCNEEESQPTMPLSTNTAELEKPGLDWCSSLLIGKAEMLIELVVCFRSSEGYQTAGNHQYFPGKCCEVP